MIEIKLISSNRKDKKYTMIYYNNNKIFKRVHFGSKGSSTYLDHKDKVKRTNYIKRHQKNENWSNPYSAGALSRYILWGAYTTLSKALKSFSNRFNFKLIYNQ